MHEGNAVIYEAPFLESARSVLRPGGALVVWSADAAPDLEQTLRATFDEVETQPHDVLLQGRDEQYWLYVARLAAA